MSREHLAELIENYHYETSLNNPQPFDSKRAFLATKSLLRFALQNPEYSNQVLTVLGLTFSAAKSPEESIKSLRAAASTSTIIAKSESDQLQPFWRNIANKDGITEPATAEEAQAQSKIKALFIEALATFKTFQNPVVKITQTADNMIVDLQDGWLKYSFNRQQLQAGAAQGLTAEKIIDRLLTDLQFDFFNISEARPWKFKS